MLRQLAHHGCRRGGSGTALGATWRGVGQRGGEVVKRSEDEASTRPRNLTTGNLTANGSLPLACVWSGEPGCVSTRRTPGAHATGLAVQRTARTGPAKNAIRGSSFAAATIRSASAVRGMADTPCRRVAAHKETPVLPATPAPCLANNCAGNSNMG